MFLSSRVFITCVRYIVLEKSLLFVVVLVLGRRTRRRFGRRFRFAFGFFRHRVELFVHARFGTVDNIRVLADLFQSFFFAEGTVDDGGFCSGDGVACLGDFGLYLGDVLAQLSHFHLGLFWSNGGRRGRRYSVRVVHFLLNLLGNLVDLLRLLFNLRRGRDGLFDQTLRRVHVLVLAQLCFFRHKDRLHLLVLHPSLRRPHHSHG